MLIVADQQGGRGELPAEQPGHQCHSAGCVLLHWQHKARRVEPLRPGSPSPSQKVMTCRYPYVLAHCLLLAAVSTTMLDWWGVGEVQDKATVNHLVNT